MFNVTSLCTYGNTPDVSKQVDILSKKRIEWQDLPEDEAIDMEANWNLLDAKRIFKENSFDFSIETVGVFENKELVILSIDVILGRLHKLNEDLESQVVLIAPSLSTMDRAFDITFVDDYTIGKPIEYLLYQNHFGKVGKALAYCGYIKMHPHDEESTIRIAFQPKGDEPSVAIVRDLLKETVNELTDIFNGIQSKFKNK
jgi:DNA-directed RNA polymerase subunit L